LCTLWIILKTSIQRGPLIAGVDFVVQASALVLNS
jgi:hypothetical protein